MTPKEHLEAALTNEPAGSPTINALFDMATLRYVKEKYRAFMKREEENEDDVENDHQMLLNFFQQATVSETIRKRRFGKDSWEYNTACDAYAELTKPYYAESPPPEVVLLQDLEEINNLKSKNVV